MKRKWLFDPGFAGELVALKAGFFKERGIDLDVRPGGFEADPIRLVTVPSKYPILDIWNEDFCRLGNDRCDRGGIRRREHGIGLHHHAEYLPNRYRATLCRRDRQAAGADTYGVAGADTFLIARAKEIPLVAFGAGYLQTPVVFYVHADSEADRK